MGPFLGAELGPHIVAAVRVLDFLKKVKRFRQMSAVGAKSEQFVNAICGVSLSVPGGWGAL